MTLEDILVCSKVLYKHFPGEAAENSENTPTHSTYPPGRESNRWPNKYEEWMRPRQDSVLWV